MNAEQARAFLKCLNAKNVEDKGDGKWLRCSCPLAYWKHKNRKDGRPSFGLSVSEHEHSHYHCFSCGSGSAEMLLQALEMFVHETTEFGEFYNFKTAHEILDNQEMSPFELGDYQEFAAPPQQPFKAWPETYLDSFMSATAVHVAREYLFGPKGTLNEFGQKCRGITEHDALRFDLRYDHQRGMVVFPYRDVNGRLAGMRGRSIVEKKHYDYTWNNVNNANQTWFNEPVLNDPGWVVVVEGQFDAMRVSIGWPKVVANMTANPSGYKLSKLIEGAEGTVLIPDNDEAGEESVARYQKFHKQHNRPFKILLLPDEIKDPDEAHPEYLRDRIIATLD